MTRKEQPANLRPQTAGYHVQHALLLSKPIVQPFSTRVKSSSALSGSDYHGVIPELPSSYHLLATVRGSFFSAWQASDYRLADHCAESYRRPYRSARKHTCRGSRSLQPALRCKAIWRVWWASREGMNDE